MKPIPLFVEICAGTAAASLRLHRRGARPPVSRMGSKSGYADTILAALGLSPGQGAERYLWAEADPGVRLLLAAYTDRRLAQGAAEVIRGWAGEEPRALWERLRAEGPCKGAPGADAREVARWATIAAGSLGGVYGQEPTDFDRYGHNPVTGERYPGNPANTVVAPALSALPEMPGRVVDSAAVDPYEVARWLRIVSANRLINVGPDWKNTGAGGSTFGGAEFCTAIEDLLRAVEGVEEMPGAVVELADFEPPRLPPGSVVMIDPPYVGTTGYGHDLPRAEVVRVARVDEYARRIEAMRAGEEVLGRAGASPRAAGDWATEPTSTATATALRKRLGQTWSTPNGPVKLAAGSRGGWVLTTRHGEPIGRGAVLDFGRGGR